MKKRLLFILMVLFLIPFININAASINRVDVSGTNSAKVGDKFSLTFHIGYSGIQRGSNNTMGVGGVLYNISFDDSVFLITNISSNGFDTQIGSSNGEYYIVSTINESNSNNKCTDEVLYCSDYEATITFYVKDTDKKSSGIKISNGSAVLFQVGSDYDEEDAVVITSSSESTQLINITKSESVVVEEPKSIVSDSVSKNIVSNSENKISKVKQNTTIKNVTTTKKNNSNPSNNYLASLRIKEHKINFDKEVLEYKIYIDDKVNTIDVEATSESETSTINIIGADDLRNNDYKVLVEVTAKDGSKKTYTINVERDKVQKVNKNEDDNDKFKIDKKIVRIIVILAIGVLVIGIIYFVITHRQNKKLDKMLDDFDKF